MLEGWVSVAITVMVAVPYLCNPGLMIKRRFVPKPLNARLELLTRLLLEELAVVVTVKMGTVPSVTPTDMAVILSSPKVTVAGNVNVGAARALRPPKPSSADAKTSRRHELAGLRRVTLAD